MLTLNVIQAEYGDSMLLRCSNGDRLNFILVDGGPSQTYERHLKPTLDAILTNKKLDLVILSHIDNDHILGLIDLFEATKGERERSVREIIRVGGLWHNSFADIVGLKAELNKITKSFVLISTHLYD